MGAPKLTDKDIEKAVLLLDGWAGKLNEPPERQDTVSPLR